MQVSLRLGVSAQSLGGWFLRRQAFLVRRALLLPSGERGTRHATREAVAIGLSPRSHCHSSLVVRSLSRLRCNVELHDRTDGAPPPPTLSREAPCLAILCLLLLLSFSCNGSLAQQGLPPEASESQTSWVDPQKTRLLRAVLMRYFRSLAFPALALDASDLTCLFSIAVFPLYIYLILNHSPVHIIGEPETVDNVRGRSCTNAAGLEGKTTATTGDWSGPMVGQTPGEACECGTSQLRTRYKPPSRHHRSNRG